MNKSIKQQEIPTSKEILATGAGPDQAFQAHVSDGRLWLQYCRDCGSGIFFPRVICNHCSSLALEWRPSSGRGHVYSRTVLHKRPKPGESAPSYHALVLVELEEGPRIMSRLPDLAPEDIKIGMRVAARIEGEEGSQIVVFDPQEAGK